jgi:uncharacterized membrane protein YraQ (UPF0718 family)
MDRGDAASAAMKTARNIKQVMPMLIGVMLLLSLVLTAVSRELLMSVFTGNAIIDPVIGALIGSIAAGNPVNSYVIGGELLQRGVSLLAVSAFVIAWVTVGIITLPAESAMLGRRFALTRNVISFVMAIVLSVAIVAALGVL